MKGVIRPKKVVETPDGLETFMLPEMNQLPELGEAVPPVPEPQITEPTPIDQQQEELHTEVERLPTPTAPPTPAPPPVERSDRPSRVTKMPDRYKDYECYPLLTNGYVDPPIVSGDTSHPPSGGSMDKKMTRLWSQVVAQSGKPAKR